MTDTLCASTAHATPPSPFSRPSTGAASHGSANQTRSLRPGPTTTAAPLLLLYRCVFTGYAAFFTLTGSLWQGGCSTGVSWFIGVVFSPVSVLHYNECTSLRLASHVDLWRHSSLSSICETIALAHCGLEHHFLLTGKCLLTLVIALQKLLSECQSYRDCQLPVNHLLFGKDPCPGTTKYLHVNYKCKPSECSSSAPVCSSLLCLSSASMFLHQFLSHLRWGSRWAWTQPHSRTQKIPPWFLSLPHVSLFTQLSTKDMWRVRGRPWSCAASPPGCWTSTQLSMAEV